MIHDLLDDPQKPGLRDERAAAAKESSGTVLMHRSRRPLRPEFKPSNPQDVAASTGVSRVSGWAGQLPRAGHVRQLDAGCHGAKSMPIGSTYRAGHAARDAPAAASSSRALGSIALGVISRVADITLRKSRDARTIRAARSGRAGRVDVGDDRTMIGLAPAERPGGGSRSANRAPDASAAAHARGYCSGIACTPQ